MIERVDAGLAAFLDERAAVARARSVPSSSPVADAARRVRARRRQAAAAALRLLGLARGARRPTPTTRPLLTAAASLELLHACALVHDDLMDASDTRRGQPGGARGVRRHAHRATGWTGDADASSAPPPRSCSATCCCPGPTRSSPRPAPTAAPRASVYDDMRQLVMAGQYLDVLVQARGAVLADDALRVVEFKTSKYTVEGPLHLGAARRRRRPDGVRRAHRLRAAARRGVPAARRRARRVRRSGSRPASRPATTCCEGKQHPARRAGDGTRDPRQAALLRPRSRRAHPRRASGARAARRSSSTPARSTMSSSASPRAPPKPARAWRRARDRRGSARRARPAGRGRHPAAHLIRRTSMASSCFLAIE